MAQDDPKEPRASGGKSVPPAAGGSPSLRDINAPASPEEPVTQPTDAAPPESSSTHPKGAEEGAEAAAAGGSGPHNAEPPPDRAKALEAAVVQATEALKQSQDALAEYKLQQEAERAAAQLVQDYAAEVEALTRSSEELDRYRHAEISFLEGFLDSETRKKIEHATEAAQAAINRLQADVDHQTTKLGPIRQARDTAKATAATATARVEALQRPAASIRERLKGAEAVRAEARKASDAGNYALAYWLVMPGGKLEQALNAEPHILEADALRKEVNAAREAQKAANQALAGRETELKTAEDALRAAQAELASLTSSRDATVSKTVAALNPPPVKAA